jgi:hypothetical protein
MGGAHKDDLLMVIFEMVHHFGVVHNWHKVKFFLYFFKITIYYISTGKARSNWNVGRAKSYGNKRFGG